MASSVVLTKMVARALSAGVLVPPRALEYRYMGMVVVEAVDDMYWVTTKSSMESANTIIMLARMAGASRGSRTSRMAAHEVAPRSRAASSNSGPIEARRLRTITTT